MVLSLCMLASIDARAQDVPGIEICTVEKTMERRTSCLQSNVDFLQKTIGKLAADHQQKLDAANRQIEGLKSAVAALQKVVDELQAAQKKAMRKRRNPTRRRRQRTRRNKSRHHGRTLTPAIVRGRKGPRRSCETAACANRAKSFWRG